MLFHGLEKFALLFLVMLKVLDFVDMSDYPALPQYTRVKSRRVVQFICLPYIYNKIWLVRVNPTPTAAVLSSLFEHYLHLQQGLSFGLGKVNIHKQRPTSSKKS